MTWTKLGDDFSDRPSLLQLGRSTRLLYVEGLVYSNRVLTDGFIPDGALRRLTDHEDPEDAAGQLEGCGLWERRPDGWYIADFHTQRTADEVRKAQRAAATRQARRRRHLAGDHTDCDPKYCKSRRDVTGDVIRDSRPYVMSSPDLTGQGLDCVHHEGQRRADGSCIGCIADRKAAS
jgi:hypothetical protein